MLGVVMAIMGRDSGGLQLATLLATFNTLMGQVTVVVAPQSVLILTTTGEP
jgi:hypothetical protein